MSHDNWKIPDWSRERPRKFWDPGRKLLKAIRDYQKIGKSSNFVTLILLKICVFRHTFWSTISGADIPLNCNIGGGLLLPHPNGVVIHPDAKIGVNCLLFQQVTITKGVVLGYHVDIGAGAKILGPVTVGNDVLIGANAVVVKDVQDNITVVGIPGHPLKKREKE